MKIGINISLNSNCSNISNNSDDILNLASCLSTIAKGTIANIRADVLSPGIPDYTYKIYIDNGLISQNGPTPELYYSVPVQFNITGLYDIRIEILDNCLGSTPVSDHCTISVIEPTTTICSWIISKGGWNTLIAFDIMTLVQGYSGVINLGFIVTAAYIMGAVAYYSKNVASGNTFTGCNFS